MLWLSYCRGNLTSRDQRVGHWGNVISGYILATEDAGDSVSREILSSTIGFKSCETSGTEKIKNVQWKLGVWINEWNISNMKKVFINFISMAQLAKHLLDMLLANIHQNTWAISKGHQWRCFCCQVVQFQNLPAGAYHANQPSLKPLDPDNR